MLLKLEQCYISSTSIQVHCKQTTYTIYYMNINKEQIHTYKKYKTQNNNWNIKPKTTSRERHCWQPESNLKVRIVFPLPVVMDLFAIGDWILLDGYVSPISFASRPSSSIRNRTLRVEASGIRALSENRSDCDTEKENSWKTKQWK